MIVLRSSSFQESREKSGSTVRSAWGGGGRVFVCFVSPGVLMMERETHMEQHGSS